MNKKIRKSFRDSITYNAARGIWRSIQAFRMEIAQGRNPDNKVVMLFPEGLSVGKVLFSYIIDGFLLEPGAPVPKTHTNIWQSIKMVETFVELGYEVEAIHYTNHRFIPKGNYSFFVDVRHNLKRLSPFLNKNCVKIMHIDTAHILYHNAAGFKRLLQLQERRRVTLRPKRFEMPNYGIEYADYATTGGNDFTVDTFRYANKKIFKLPSPCGITLDWRKKDWDRCRKNFLWFSSSDLIHKGLDLALEAFKEIPDCHLTVCGPLERDQDFVREYHKELYETPNIRTVGWVDIDSEEFREITESCGAMLHLSCSEGGAPSVKMCMHGGLIPIVSYESGVDVHDFGFVLTDCSVNNIIKIIKHFSAHSQNEIEEKARKTWEFSRRYHTRENFANEYRKVILSIIEDVKNNRCKAIGSEV